MTGLRMILILTLLASTLATVRALRVFPATASETIETGFRETGSGTQLSSVLLLLESSDTGRSLLQKAMHAWRLRTKAELESRLKWGSVSRTDAVLIRHYDPETGHESRERRVSIYLRQDQNLADVMLDLAHELVHATSNPSWDPYDPNLSPARYIQAAIEGEGGEVEAVRAECQVSRELYGEASKLEAASRCRRYWGAATQARTTDLIRKDFYRVGHWMDELKKRLGSDVQKFPLLSEEKPALYSSTGGAPYPVALLEEYRQMTAVACENTRKRSPASASEQDPEAADVADGANVRAFLQRRCKK